VLRSQRIAEQQVYGNLLAAGAQIGTYLYTMRELRGTMQTTPTAPAAPAAGPMSFPPSGIFGPAPTMPAGRMALPGGTLGQWPTYQFSAMAGAAPSATAPPTTPRMALTLPPASTPFGTLGPPGLDLARMLAALQPPRPPLAAEENPALARFLEYLHPGAY